MAVLLLLSHCVLLDIDTLGMYEEKSCSYCLLYSPHLERDKRKGHTAEEQK